MTTTEIPIKSPIKQSLQAFARKKSVKLKPKKIFAPFLNMDKK